MELKDVILGFLDWKPLTGYELKGMFAALDFLHWSGNNNQIYTALIELEKKGMVTKEVLLQENRPPQKRYSATQKGRERIREAVLAETDEPAIINAFLMQIAWAEALSREELLALIGRYEASLEAALAMCREKSRRQSIRPQRSEREAYLWDMIAQHRAMSLQNEINWLVRLQNGLANRGE